MISTDRFVLSFRSRLPLESAVHEMDPAYRTRFSIAKKTTPER